MSTASKTPSEILREPFPESQIGKLPRINCTDCSKAQGKVCDKHRKQKCAECGNYITTSHIHLDYVGHAAVTDRLLQVDTNWTWDFQAVNGDGSPVVFTSGLADPNAKVGIWIKLTVIGVTRPGFGEGKNFKEAIGDALRNAAMRFGVALDLWSKEDLHADDHDEDPPKASGAPTPAPDATPPSAKKQADQLAEYTKLAEAYALLDKNFNVEAGLKAARAMPLHKLKDECRGLEGLLDGALEGVEVAA